MANPVSTNQNLRALRRDHFPRQSASEPTHQYEILMDRLLSAGFGSAAMQTVGLTSSQSGEGVTTVACNLALHASGSHQLRVLLVDANFSRPGLDQIFQIPQSPGLTDLWNGEADELDCIHDLSKRPVKSWPAALRPSFRKHRNRSRSGAGETESRPLLSVLTTGSKTNIAHDFSRARDEGFLEPVCSEFDLVIVDLPAVNSPTHRWISLANLDGVLFVIEAEQTPDLLAQKSLLEIQQQGAHLLGVALNRCRNHLPKWIDKKLGTGS